MKPTQPMTREEKQNRLSREISKLEKKIGFVPTQGTTSTRTADNTQPVIKRKTEGGE